ncbi:MAG: flagellin lysine-N-methylase [Lachnospiraceae bacterium]|nr:flagellin lysine-N-methylase [Lachnospiraceae bacterium]
MEIDRISFYDDFRCVAGDCVETCCRGWSILADEAALEKYRREKGLLGLRLKLAVRGKEEPQLNAGRGTCPFFTRDGLCGLQKQRGRDYMPLTCQVYPRRRKHFGPLAEETLDLSCVEAARMFLAAKDLSFRRLQGDISYGRHGSNTDEAFFGRLLASREKLLARLTEAKEKMKEAPFEESRVHLSDAFADMLHLAGRWQRNAATGKELFAADAADAEPVSASLFPLPVTLLNEWVNGCLHHAELKRRIPFFYRLLTFYMKRFDGLDERKGQMRLDRLFRETAKKGLLRTEHYLNYAQYELYRFYTESYEDYSFLNRIRCMVMHTNLLLLFDALFADERGQLTEEERARIIAVYEKRARHSAQMEKNMLQAWQAREAEVPYV